MQWSRYLPKAPKWFSGRVRDGLSSTHQVVREDFNATKQLVQNFAQPPDELEGDYASASPKEKFSATLHAAGRTEADLPSIEKSAQRAHVFWACSAIVAFLWIVVSSVHGFHSNTGSLLDYFFPITFLALILSKAFASAASLYRIRARSMVPALQVLKDPAALLGAHPPRSAMVAALAMGLGLGVGFPADQALAQGAGGAITQAGSSLGWFFQQSGAEDLSLEWMRKFFPGIGSLLGGSDSPADPLGAMFGAFNAILMGIGCMMLTWYTVIATVSTAHEGKVMGQRWHQAWAPIRVLVGLTMVAPAKAGYCLAQILVILMISGGYNIANGLYSAYTSRMVSNEMASIASSTSPNMGLQLAHNVAQAEICYSILNEGRNRIGGATWNPLTWFSSPPPPVTPPPAEGVPGAAYEHGSHHWNYGSLCGSFRLSPYTERSYDAGANDFTQAPAEAFNAARKVAVTNLINAVRASHIGDVVRAKVMPNPPPSSETDAQAAYAEVVKAGQIFTDEIETAARAMAQSLNEAGKTEFLATATRLGWASAGALNPTLVRAQARVAEMVGSAAPAYRGVDFDAIKTTNDDLFNWTKKGIDGLNSNSRLALGAQADALSPTLSQDLQGRNAVARVLQPITNGIAELLVDSSWVQLNTANPMGSMQTLGNTVLLLAQTGWLAWATLHGGAEAAASSIGGFVGAGAIKGVLTGLGGLVVPVLLGLTVAGILHTYILPMLPFLMWFYAIISVASLAAELVIAAPIAAFMHIKADGQELINNEQRTIYVMVFNALMRPSLLLMGLVVANLMFSVGATYLNKTVSLAMLSAQGDTIIGLFGWLTMLLLTFYLHYQLVVRCMSLVSAVPAAVSSILQVSDQDRGEHNESTKVFAAVGNMSKSGANQAARAVIPRKPQTETPGGGGSTPAPGAGAKTPDKAPGPASD